MRVVNVDSHLINRLRSDGLSTKMKSLEFCKFLVIEEDNGKIIGASGVGGILNVHSLQVMDGYQGMGLGKKLFGEMITELKKRKYFFITDSINPQNIPVVKLIRAYGFKTIFRINYSEDITRDAGILVLRPAGKIIEKIFRIFNTKIGLILLIILLKLTQFRFTQILTLPLEEFSKPDFRYILTNFEKCK